MSRPPADLQSLLKRFWRRFCLYNRRLYNQVPFTFIHLLVYIARKRIESDLSDREVELVWKVAHQVRVRSDERIDAIFERQLLAMPDALCSVHLSEPHDRLNTKSQLVKSGKIFQLPAVTSRYNLQARWQKSNLTWRQPWRGRLKQPRQICVI